MKEPKLRAPNAFPRPRQLRQQCSRWTGLELLEPRILLSALSFQTAASYTAGSSPWSIAAGDFNGEADLAN